jgi:cell division inhibitor SepF
MSFFQRLRDLLGLDDLYDDYDYEGYGDGSYDAYGDGAYGPGEPNGKQARMPQLPPGQSAMIMMQPQSFDEMPDAVAALRDRRSVILDLTLIDIEHAQRCADYVAGGAFAMDGQYRQLGENVFLFTPRSVHISHYTSVEEAMPVVMPPAVPQKSSAQAQTALQNPSSQNSMGQNGAAQNIMAQNTIPKPVLRYPLADSPAM